MDGGLTQVKEIKKMGKRNFYQSNIEEPSNATEEPIMDAPVTEEVKEKAPVDEPKKEEPKVEVKPAEPVKPIKKEEKAKKTATL